ncbi:MAG: hypothetical protein IKS17_02530 [Firmicutes bacterium]|nr:hypothetical protein [Bacillota bacterium]
MLKNTLKRSLRDVSGNSLIIALLAMAVSVLLVASFMYSTQSAAKVEAKVDANEQSYLVAKSGMVLFEDYLKQLEDDGKTADEICAMYNNPAGYTASVGDGSMGTFTVYVNKNSHSPNGYSITSIGEYGDQHFKLYDYYEVEEDDDDTDRDGEGTSPKAACITYNSGTVDYTGGVDGDIQQLSTSGTLTDAKLKGDLGTVYSVGNIDFDGDGAGNFSVKGVFGKGTLTVGHAMTIKGETYVGELVKGSSTSGVTFGNDVYVQGDMDWNEEGGSNLVNGSVYVGGDADITCLEITKNIYVDGDLTLYGGTIITGDVYCNGTVTFKQNNQGGATVGGSVYAKDGIKIIASNTRKHSIGGILFTYGTIIDATPGNEFSGRYQYSTGPKGSFNAEELKTLAYGSSSDSALAKAKILDTLGSIAAQVEEKLDKSLPKTSKPVTTVPSNLKDGSAVTYNSWSDVPTYGDAYYISQDCVFNFFADLSGKNMIIKADGADLDGKGRDKVDIYFKAGLAVWDAASGECSADSHIYVDDTGHRDIIRFFFPAKADIVANSGIIKFYGQWAVEPVRNEGGSISTIPTDSYVPNLYVFTEDEASNIADYGKVFGQQATYSCFPGYWLTPNCNIGLANNCAYTAGTEVSKSGNNFPIIHGMLTSDMMTNENGNGTMILYHDPDVDKDSGKMLDGLAQSWPFNDATAGVYVFPS